jgi:hypothetical protein
MASPLLESLKEFASPCSCPMPPMRPWPDEPHGTHACHAAAAWPAVRHGVRGSALPAPGAAQARPAGSTGRSWRLASPLMGALPGDALAGLAQTTRRPRPARHATTSDKVFAQWADAGALGQAFVARVRPRAAEKQRERTVLQGDGTTPGATKGARAGATRATNIRRAPRALPSSPRLAPALRLALGLLAMRPPWACARQA